MAHSIGKTIAELRKAKGWTQIELAKTLNVSDKAVSKWESEGGFPEITQLPVLAKIFDVSIDYLMTGKETEPEIITMSKIELCAKNDDVSMLAEIKGYDITDENGKSLQDYKKEQERKDNLFKMANIKVSTGVDLVNIYFQPCCDEYKYTEIALYKENMLLAKYKVDEETFFKSIGGLAFGTYEFILKQFDKKNNIILETDKISFSISAPNYSGRRKITIGGR